MASTILSNIITNKTAIIIPVFPENPKTLILEKCKTIRDLSQVHAHMIKTQLHRDSSLTKYLLESAAIHISEPMDHAISIFSKLKEPNSSYFNIMIRGFTYKHSPYNALVLFDEMLEKFVVPDEFTFSCVLKACSNLLALEEGKQIHGHVVKSGCVLNGFVKNSLICMYGNCGEVEHARHLFDGLSERSIVTWNAMFSGYTKMKCWEKIVQLFHYMLETNAMFDAVTLVCVLTACGRLGNLELGEWINGYIEANGLMGNSTLLTSLVDMYSKCGRLDTARNLFDQMPRSDVVAWSAMISGYNQAGQCKEALSLFHEMQKVNVEPNEVTMVSVLSSCAHLGALETGKWVHFYIKKKKLKLTVTLGTALLTFYAKCGSTNCLIEVFDEMPSKNVLSWTVLIQGLASNGQGRMALQFFNIMLEENIEPNDMTFIGVLSACSHAGLVDEGRNYFVSMSRDFGVEPRMEHYGCMVDILGRAGLIEDAYQFVINMPVKPNAVIWRTLLASCKVHKNVEIGETSLEHIGRMAATHSGDYILLSNLYASVGRSEDAARLWSLMKEKGIKKTPGCSLIELDGVVHEFFASDDVHPNSEEIYASVTGMLQRIKIAGYVPEVAKAVEDDMVSSASHHSEKLAIAFGLVKTPPGTTIRISKNLRVCTDCHNATKMISKVFNREIIVRDRVRFHHFRDGLCSCDDYW